MLDRVGSVSSRPERHDNATRSFMQGQEIHSDATKAGTGRPSIVQRRRIDCGRCYHRMSS